MTKEKKLTLEELIEKSRLGKKSESFRSIFRSRFNNCFNEFGFSRRTLFSLVVQKLAKPVSTI